MEPIDPTIQPESRRAKFEVRPSAGRAWNPDAPDEVVLTDGKSRGFGDLLQALNPLQHLPVVGTLYREFTGSTIEPAARVVGGLIFGGPVGIATALVNAFVEEESGKDIGGHLAAMVLPSGADPNAPPPPPAPGDRPMGGTDGALFLAAFGAAAPTHDGGTTESDGLLSTWIAGGQSTAPQTLEARVPVPNSQRALPTHLALYDAPSAAMRNAPVSTPAPASSPASSPVEAPANEAPQTSPQLASAAPAAAGLPEFLPTTGRGRSLADYRASAHALPPSALRMPAITDPLANQRVASRTAAAANAAAALPAALDAQRQVEANAAGAEQNWVATMMSAGLDRYRAAQRQRDANAPSSL